MRRRGRGLTGEDERLWAGVARSVVPLKGVVAPSYALQENPAEGAPPPAPSTAMRAEPLSRAPKASPRLLTQHPIERPTRRKIARGRLAIEARIDLHEMTQASAHDALQRFLRQAQAMGLRHVLVITGRAGSASAGLSGRGVLRRVVPLWFSGPAFRPLVSGYEGAERHHGGDGALYVRVRKLR